MMSTQIVPEKEDIKKEIVLRHKNGEIIKIGEEIFQVILYSQPERQIYSSSVENAFRILMEESVLEKLSSTKFD